MRSNARRLLWSVLVLMAVSAAVGYLTGNLPAPFADWMLWAAATVIVLVLVVIPYLRWAAHTYTITTRRVIEQRGLLVRRRVELTHLRGYTITERRGPLQRLWRSGTLVLSDGVDAPLRLVDVPSVALVHEVLADQVEVSQIIAHRDSQAIPLSPQAPPADPPQS
ncbi:MAG: PH domain-containing protein [Microbacterium sp.]